MPDHYKTLGLKSGASLDEIKQAYRELAKTYHPDVNKEPGAEEKFKEVKNAYEALTNPSASSKHDIFDQIKYDFSRSYSSSFRDFHTQPQQDRGTDAQSQLEVELETVAFGKQVDIMVPSNCTCSDCSGVGSKSGSVKSVCQNCSGTGIASKKYREARREVHYQYPCPLCNGEGKCFADSDRCSSCNGRGLVDFKEQVRISIPSGVQDGDGLRVPEKGFLRRPNGKRGNLILRLTLKPHEIFEVSGHDLVLAYPLRLRQAILGDTITIPTLYGPKQVKVQKGTQNLSSTRIKGLGLPNKQKINGDLIVCFTIEMPRVDSPTDGQVSFDEVERKEYLPLTYAKLEKLERYMKKGASNGAEKEK